LGHIGKIQEVLQKLFGIPLKEKRAAGALRILRTFPLLPAIISG
jgi:hypothetical protein